VENATIKNKVVLVIVDGFGIAPSSDSNAISLANTPNWDKLCEEFPNTQIEASGNSVGLPSGVMGNSEVGHLTIGTGRRTYQALELINRACKDGSLADNPLIEQIINHLKETNGSLHLMGLLSDGGVHSHQNHLDTLIDIFTYARVNQIWIHAFTDGRDTSPTSSVNYIDMLIDKIGQNPVCSLSTIIGRYFVMDRDKKWERTKIAYDMLVAMEGSECESDPITEINQRYKAGETDEFLKPIIVNPRGQIKSGDAVLFFNFRPDRARQITIMLNGLQDYQGSRIDNLFFTSMTNYEASWKFPVLFPSVEIELSLAEILSNHGLRQAHIAETEKSAHITYFLNGGKEEPFAFETRVLIPSLKIATYDLQPEMRTSEICKETVDLIQQKRHEFIVINIASPDMVGHTGNIPATIKAIETMDDTFAKLYKECQENDYILIITSDHGNCEKMIANGSPHTAHTNNLVPFLITRNIELIANGGLENIAPTILDLLGLPKPEIMSGISLLKDNE
jgi:2,3-bisphosphoglycerate-independent phosphoglycerate mutase